jgi:putative cobalt transporter subunit CbtB
VGGRRFVEPEQLVCPGRGVNRGLPSGPHQDLALPRRLDAGPPGPNTYVGQLNLLRHQAVRKSAIRLLSDQPEVDVAETAAVPAARALPPPIPLREVLPWAAFAGVVLLTLLYLVGLDQGATSFSGSMIHEFLHDGRHLLGFPCH